MTKKDEELQNLIETASSSIDSVDAYAYRKVFDTLKQEPDFHLPINFEDKIIQKIEAEQESARDYLWFGLGIFLFAVAALFTILLTNFKVSFRAFKFISVHPGLFIFGVAFVLALHWLDKKLIRTRETTF